MASAASASSSEAAGDPTLWPRSMPEHAAAAQNTSKGAGGNQEENTTPVPFIDIASLPAHLIKLLAEYAPRETVQDAEAAAAAAADAAAISSDCSWAFRNAAAQGRYDEYVVLDSQYVPAHLRAPPSNLVAVLPVKGDFQDLEWLRVRIAEQGEPKPVTLPFPGAGRIPSLLDQRYSAAKRGSSEFMALLGSGAERTRVFIEDLSEAGRTALQRRMERTEIAADAMPEWQEQEGCFASVADKLGFLERIEPGTIILRTSKQHPARYSTSHGAHSYSSLNRLEGQLRSSGQPRLVELADRVVRLLDTHRRVHDLSGRRDIDVTGIDGSTATRKVSILELFGMLSAGNLKGAASFTTAFTRHNIGGGILAPAAHLVRIPDVLRRLSIDRRNIIFQTYLERAELLNNSLGSIAADFFNAVLLPEEIDACHYWRHRLGGLYGAHEDNVFTSTFQLNVTVYSPTRKRPQRASRATCAASGTAGAGRTHGSDSEEARTGDYDAPEFDADPLEAEEPESLAVSLGIRFGANHTDEKDDPARWTLLIPLGEYPPGTHGGTFHEFESGSYVELDPDDPLFFFFRGVDCHVGTPPSLPPTYEASPTDKAFARAMAVAYPMRLAAVQNPPVAYDVDTLTDHPAFVHAGAASIPLLADERGIAACGGTAVHTLLLLEHRVRRHFEDALRDFMRTRAILGELGTDAVRALQRESEAYLRELMSAMGGAGESWREVVEREAARMVIAKPSLASIMPQLVAALQNEGNPYANDGQPAYGGGAPVEADERRRRHQLATEVSSIAHDRHTHKRSAHNTDDEYLASRGLCAGQGSMAGHDIVPPVPPPGFDDAFASPGLAHLVARRALVQPAEFDLATQELSVERIAQALEPGEHQSATERGVAGETAADDGAPPSAPASSPAAPSSARPDDRAAPLATSAGTDKGSEPEQPRRSLRGITIGPTGAVFEKTVPRAYEEQHAAHIAAKTAKSGKKRRKGSKSGTARVPKDAPPRRKPDRSKGKKSGATEAEVPLLDRLKASILEAEDPDPPSIEARPYSCAHPLPQILPTQGSLARASTPPVPAAALGTRAGQNAALDGLASALACIAASSAELSAHGSDTDASAHLTHTAEHAVWAAASRFVAVDVFPRLREMARVAQDARLRACLAHGDADSAAAEAAEAAAAEVPLAELLAQAIDSVVTASDRPQVIKIGAALHPRYAVFAPPAARVKLDAGNLPDQVAARLSDILLLGAFEATLLLDTAPEDDETAATHARVTARRLALLHSRLAIANLVSLAFPASAALFHPAFHSLIRSPRTFFPSAKHLDSTSAMCVPSTAIEPLCEALRALGADETMHESIDAFARKSQERRDNGDGHSAALTKTLLDLARTCPGTPGRRAEAGGRQTRSSTSTQASSPAERPAPPQDAIYPLGPTTAVAQKATAESTSSRKRSRPGALNARVPAAKRSRATPQVRTKTPRKKATRKEKATGQADQMKAVARAGPAEVREHQALGAAFLEQVLVAGAAVLLDAPPRTSTIEVSDLGDKTRELLHAAVASTAPGPQEVVRRLKKQPYFFQAFREGHAHRRSLQLEHVGFKSMSKQAQFEHLVLLRSGLIAPTIEAYDLLPPGGLGRDNALEWWNSSSMMAERRAAAKANQLGADGQPGAKATGPFMPAPYGQGSIYFSNVGETVKRLSALRAELDCTTSFSGAVKVLSQAKLPAISTPLGSFLLAGDLSYHGFVHAPTHEEMGERIHTLSAGAVEGLLILGLYWPAADDSADERRLKIKRAYARFVRLMAANEAETGLSADVRKELQLFGCDFDDPLVLENALCKIGRGGWRPLRLKHDWRKTSPGLFDFAQPWWAEFWAEAAADGPNYMDEDDEVWDLSTEHSSTPPLNDDDDDDDDNDEDKDDDKDENDDDEEEEEEGEEEEDELENV